MSSIYKCPIHDCVHLSDDECSLPSPVSEKNIVQVPFETLVREGLSQRDRIVTQVMTALWETLPDKAESKPSFMLPDGTKCWLKKFSAPYQDESGQLVYGFDVQFEESNALHHLEFAVTCSGWERQ